MGLDLFHLKATLTPIRIEDAHAFREEDFDEDALDLLGFRRFLQTIPDFDYPQRILAMKDENTLEILRAHDLWHLKQGVEIIVGAPEALAHRVEQFEKAQGLDSKGRLVYAATNWIDRFGGHISRGHGGIDRRPDERHWEPTVAVREELRRRPPHDCPPVQCISISYPVASPYIGLYAEQFGYQRKGMSDEFYESFRNGTCYVHRSDIERAERLLKLSGPPEENRMKQEHFAEQFLGEFVEGESIFYFSW